MFVFKDIVRINPDGTWYVRALKVLAALVGAWLLVAVLFVTYGLISGFISGASHGVFSK
jgi:hypothetical protein